MRWDDRVYQKRSLLGSNQYMPSILFFPIMIKKCQHYPKAWLFSSMRQIDFNVLQQKLSISKLDRNFLKRSVIRELLWLSHLTHHLLLSRYEQHAKGLQTGGLKRSVTSAVLYLGQKELMLWDVPGEVSALSCCKYLIVWNSTVHIWFARQLLQVF